MKLSDLKNDPLFRNLDIEIPDRLAHQKLHSHSFSQGDVIYSPGDDTKGIYVVLPKSPKNPEEPKARLEIVDTVNNETLKGDHTGAHEILGEIEHLANGLFGNPPARKTRVTALSSLTVVEIPTDLVQEISELSKTFAARLIREGTTKLLAYFDLQSSRRHASVEVNLACLLVDIASVEGQFIGNRVVFNSKITQDRLAEELGVSRRSVLERLQYWARLGLLEPAPLTLLDINRLQYTAQFADTPAQDIVAKALLEIDKLLENGDNLSASLFATQLLSVTPNRPELLYRLALASVRLGDHARANQILARFQCGTQPSIGTVVDSIRAMRQQDHGNDEDEDANIGTLLGPDRTLAIDVIALRARIEKDAAFSNSISRSATISAELYLDLFAATQDSFPGINAASMYLIGGDTIKAREISERVKKRLKTREASYWIKATMAEAELVLGNTDLCCRYLAQAMKEDEATAGNVATTRLQFSRICNATDTDPHAILSVLAVPRPVIFSGMLVVRNKYERPVFESIEAKIRQKLESILSDVPQAVIYSSLACGSDIIFCELAVTRGFELHIVLPFDFEPFIAQSIALGESDQLPGDWEKRFWKCIDVASTVTVLNRGSVPVRGRDASYQNCIHYCASQAIQRANALQTSPLLIAVEDERDNGYEYGTSKTIAHWTQKNRELMVARVSRQLPAKPVTATAPNPFACVLHIQCLDADLSANELARAKKIVSATLPGLDIIVRKTKGRQQSMSVAPGNIETSLQSAKMLMQVMAEHGIEANIVCDHGLAKDRVGKLDPTQLAKLRGGQEGTSLPFASPLATRTFMSEALYHDAKDIAFIPINESSDSSQGMLPINEKLFIISYL